MQTIRGARILLALKTSLAVALSWVVAQRMPGVIDDYPYYAPLGAISAMYPTVLGSVRAGLQTVAGIALGIMLAAGVLLVGDPNLVTVSVAVGVGVLLAGIRRLGAGAEYVPVGALFVLIVGGQDAEGGTPVSGSMYVHGMRARMSAMTLIRERFLSSLSTVTQRAPGRSVAANIASLARE